MKFTAIISLVALSTTSVPSVAESELGPGLLGMPMKMPKEAQRLNFDPIPIQPEVTKVGVRFTALRDGALEEFTFPSTGEGINQSPNPAFEVEIFECEGSSPGKSLGKSTSVESLTDGPRGRRAIFSGIQLKKGSAYLASISRPTGATGSMSVYQTYRPGEMFSRDTVDPLLKNPGYALLVSSDGGSSWTEEAAKLMVHGVRIGDHWQGWAYDVFWDGLRIFKSETEEQVIAQTFKLELPEGQASARPTSVALGLRSSPGLAGQTLELQARLLNQDSGNILSEGTLAYSFADASLFYQPEIAFSKTTAIKAGTQVVLVIGFTNPYSKTPEDFLFVRSPNYSLGHPKPVELTWQGAPSAAYHLPAFELPTTQKPVNGALTDLPFVLRYEVE